MPLTLTSSAAVATMAAARERICIQPIRQSASSGSAVSAMNRISDLMLLQRW